MDQGRVDAAGEEARDASSTADAGAQAATEATTRQLTEEEQRASLLAQQTLWNLLGDLGGLGAFLKWLFNIEEPSLDDLRMGAAADYFEDLSKRVLSHEYSGDSGKVHEALVQELREDQRAGRISFANEEREQAFFKGLESVVENSRDVPGNSDTRHMAGKLAGNIQAHAENLGVDFEGRAQSNAQFAANETTHSEANHDVLDYSNPIRAKLQADSLQVVAPDGTALFTLAEGFDAHDLEVLHVGTDRQNIELVVNEELDEAKLREMMQGGFTISTAVDPSVEGNEGNSVPLGYYIKIDGENGAEFFVGLDAVTDTTPEFQQARQQGPAVDPAAENNADSGGTVDNNANPTGP